MCNWFYKIVSKVLALRLRSILDEIISEEQSAFVPGRLITDDVLVAYESVHTMKRRKKGKNYACAVKLDMMKAYDRVDWNYLKKMMQKLDFAHRWVDWIMACVTSVRFFVKFNGAILDLFALTRGLPPIPIFILICS